MLLVWWSSRPAWSRAHRFAAATGATLACTAAPYVTIATWPKIDVVGEAIFDALALIGFLLLARKVFAGAKTADGQALTDLRMQQREKPCIAGSRGSAE